MIKANEFDLLITIHDKVEKDVNDINLVLELRRNFLVLSYYAIEHSEGEFSVGEIDYFLFRNIKYCIISKYLNNTSLNNIISESVKLIEKYSINLTEPEVFEFKSRDILINEYTYSNLYYVNKLHIDSMKLGITSNKIIALYKKLIVAVNTQSDDILEEIIKLNDTIIQESMLLYEKGNYLTYASTIKQDMEFINPTNKSILYAGNSYIVFSYILELTKDTGIFVYTTDKFINPIFYSKLARYENYNGVIRTFRNKLKVPVTYEGSIIVDNTTDFNLIVGQNNQFKVFEIDNYINATSNNETLKNSLFDTISSAIRHSMESNSLLKSDYKHIYSGFSHRYIADKKEVLLNRLISKEINEVIILAGFEIDNKIIDDLLKDATSRFIMTCGLDQKIISKYKDNNYVVSSADINDLYTVCKSIEFVNSSLINALKVKPKIFISATLFEEFRYISIFRYFDFSNITVLSKDIHDDYKALFSKMYDINVIKVDEDTLAIA